MGTSPNDGDRAVDVGACALLLAGRIVGVARPKSSVARGTRCPLVHLALRVGLEEIEELLGHARDMDARGKEPTSGIAFQTLQPAEPSVGAGGAGRSIWWRQICGQGSQRHS